MRNKRLLAVALAMCAALLLSLTALGETSEQITLSDWEGVWNSFPGYMDDKELEQPIKQLAEEKNITVEELKAGPAKMMASEILSMRVDGNDITFFDGFEDRNGKTIDKASYQFVKTHTLKYGNFDFEIHEFQATPDAKYPVLLLTDVHGEESMTHFHLRYGQGVDSLIKQEDWYPTFVKPTATYEQLMAGFAHSDGSDEHDHNHDKQAETPVAIQADVTLEDWAGTWNNMGAYLEDEPIQAAFEELAKKEGTTLEEEKEKYIDKRRCDFGGLEFTANHIRFFDTFADKEGKVIAEGGYAYAETYQVKHGNHDMEWHVFKAEDEKALYPVLLLMDVHGEEALTHFHLRYGTDAQALLAQDGWYPTFVKPNATYDQLVQEITE